MPLDAPQLVGQKGNDAVVWRWSSSAPSDSTGNNGDWHLNIATADLYCRASGSYQLMVNLKGPQGIQGIQGPAGDVSGAWPIGSVFLSVVSTNPATLLGLGTWVQIAGGRMLVGQIGSDADFNTAEETGGEKTHVLTMPEIPSHTHVQQLPGGQTGNYASGTRDTSAGGTGGTPSALADALSTQATGGGGAHNNMPPYLVVYIWKRTA